MNYFVGRTYLSGDVIAAFYKVVLAKVRSPKNVSLLVS